MKRLLRGGIPGNSEHLRLEVDYRNVEEYLHSAYEIHLTCISVFITEA
jgi:hypothetical protein